MQELIKQLGELVEQIRDAIARLQIERDEAEIKKLTAETLEPDFWSDSVVAAATSQKLAALQKHVESWRGLEAEVSDALELSKLGDSSDGELIADIRRDYEKTRSEFDARQFELKLSGAHDREGAILEIHAGTGGTDAQDWAQ